MLTNYDELTCHQSVDTFNSVSTSDRAWTEKIWCNLHDGSGKIVLASGLGIYPNRNVIDGYGCVNVDNRRQTNIRLSRQLRPRIDELSVGLLSYEVLEPYKRIRLAMAENEYGLSYDVEFVGMLQPGEEDPQFGRSLGRVFVNTCRYAQLGRARGWIKVDGEKYTVAEDSFFAQRDHSWGIRMGVGAPEQGVQTADIALFTGMMINWFTVQFESYGLYCYLIEKADGRVERLTGMRVGRMDQDVAQLKITKVEHDYVYHQNSPRMKSGQVILTLEDGQRLELQMRELTTMYLRGGAYLGYKGVTHGLWMGESWQDGESWEFSKPGDADEVHGLNDTVIEVRCNGEVGYGIIENLILPPFPRYGF